MSRRAATITAILATAAILAACGGDDQPDPTPAAPTQSANVPAASPVSTEPLAVGETATLNGIEVTVTDVELDPPARESSALVSVRLANTDAEARAVDFNVICDSGDSHGRTFYDGEGALDPGQEVAPGNRADGVLLFSIPDDCANPALSAKPTGAFDESTPQESATWSLD